MPKISRYGGPSHLSPLPTEVVLTLDGQEQDVTDLVVEHEGIALEVVELPADDEAEHDLIAEVVPEGTVDEVIGWTEDDADPPARLLAARDAEAARPVPRVTLTGELERRLAQF